MVMLGWGTPTLIRAELGIVIEVPLPVRVAILGQVTMALPVEQAPVVMLRVDILGTLDLERGEASVDASLIDSRIATFPISGDLAVRLRWGSDPTFALSAGGFHPGFTPPPGFPSLRRLAISLTEGENPMLRLEAYLALTTNTVQLGARLELYAAHETLVGTFSVSGHLSFDALLQFEPFTLRVELGGSLWLKRDSEALFGVEVSVTLHGPQPWHAVGVARFEFFGKREIHFDALVGDPAPIVAAASPEPSTLLAAALAAPEAWSGHALDASRAVVSLREPEPGTGVLIHPLADVVVRQKTLPLGRMITRIGTAKLPAGGARFDVAAAEIGGAARPVETVSEPFAPAQFAELSDAQKLSAPAFEPMPAGVRIGAAAPAFGAAVETELGWETAVVDDEGPRVVAGIGRTGLRALDAAVLAGGRDLGPSDRGTRVEVTAPAFTVARIGDLHALTERRSWLEAQTEALALADGAAGDGMRVVEAHMAVRR
jgi:hypothetical protein